MRFLAIERMAVDELVSDRQSQSIEFERGYSIAHFLQSRKGDLELGPHIIFEKNNDGVYLLNPNSDSNDILVFDFDESDCFKKQSDREVILVFQKILRFAVRYWKSQKFTATEKILLHSSKAVVFPFPFSQKNSYRVTIEREPDAKRASKRTAYGNDLLVYRCSTTEGEGPKEISPVANYRKAVSGLSEARKLHARSDYNEPNSANITALDVTHLGSEIEKQSNLYQGYDRWMSGVLTQRQQEIIDKPLLSPHRIEGPAGTGKTLCLVLKAISTLKSAKKTNKEMHSLLITHSEATKQNVQQIVDSIDEDSFSHIDRNMSLQSLRVATLQDLCGEFLGRNISESEYLDRDAMESKQTQLLYAYESAEETLRNELATFEHFLSPEFESFLNNVDKWELSELLQHEISVLIKGRAGGELDNYKKLPCLKHGMPAITSSDKGFVFQMYQLYQKKLQMAGQFDTDDIVLTAIGQLDTPIWFRRREKEGYDAIYIDETHLFNINELSVFHYLTRNTTSFPIACTVDRSQAVGDWGWSDDSFDIAVRGSSESPDEVDKTVMQTIFRSSPEIINLACSVTASGASLFTNFDNPLDMAVSVLTEEEERKSTPPTYFLLRDDNELIRSSFEHAEAMAKSLSSTKADVAIVAFSEELFEGIRKYAQEHNKPIEVLHSRGDIDTVNKAKKSGRFILGAPEYVGGLEFEGVVLVGADKGRVPPTKGEQASDSTHFLNYASHNRLYVALTRAKYRVEILASKERGLSILFDSSVKNGFLQAGASE